MRLSVILPCYNEAAALPKVLEDWKSQHLKILAATGISSIEMIVVDDGSTDGATDALRRPGVRIIRHNRNRGYGQSLKTGMQAATGDWIVFHDCDGTCRASDFLRLWELRRQADLIVGLRTQAGTRMPRHRQLGNAFYRFVFRFLFSKPAHDLCSGYRLFHKSWVPHFIEHLPNQLNFTLAMSLWMTLQGHSIRETEIQYGSRLGCSKLSAWKDGWRFLLTLMRYRYSLLPGNSR